MATNETQPTQLSMEQGPSLAAIPTPAPEAESVMVLASNNVSSAADRLAAQPAPSIKADAYSVSVKAPPAGGMLAYLVGPGAQIELVGIDLNSATLAQEGGNLRITLSNGAEVLLLDYVSSAKDSSTVVITDGGKLPAQQLLAALDETQVAQKVADVEPAAGPAAGAGATGGGLTPPTILGTGVGEGEGIFSSVIGPFALPVPFDEIKTEEFRYDLGQQPAPVPPVTPPANLPPFAHNDSFSTAKGVSLTLDPSKLLVNDTDPEGDPLTIVSVQGAEHGTVSIVNGKVVFIPEPGFTGTGSFSYTITDGHGGTSTADVIIQIDPDPSTENNVIAADDAETVVSGGIVKVDVLKNDSDPEGDALVPGSVRIITQPSSGSVTVNPDGTISYHADPSITTGHFVTFVYEVSDARGAKDTATVTIEVLSATNTVDAIDDTGFIQPAGAVKSFNVVANDIDPQGDAFKITSIGQPKLANGTVVGTASFDPATGLVTYNSVNSSTGYTVSIEYTITDARGATDTATLTINVQPGAANSVEAKDDTADMLAGQAVNIDVLRNDVDPQGDTFSIKAGSATQPVDASGNPRGSVSIVNGKIVYTDTPGARNSGVVEFTYTIVDSKGAEDTAVVRVTIGTAPNGVDANNDTFDVNHNAAEANITATLRANDFDPQGDTFTITSVSPLTIGQGTVRIANGQVFFTPAKDYTGPVVFTYTITDSHGATDTAQVYINVKPPVVEPGDTSVVAGNDNFSTNQNTALTITSAQVLSNDYDPEGSTLNSANIIRFTQPSNGTVSRDASGNFVFTPANGFSGTTSFTYTIKDADGDEATATVVIRVNEPAPLDNPVDAVNDLMIVSPGQTKTLNVLANDSAPDGGLAFVRVVGTLPAGVTNLGGGKFSYTAPLGANNGDTITFQYEARDVDGDTDIATVTIRILDRPVDAKDDAFTTNEDTPISFTVANLLANDSAPDGGLAFVRTVGTLPAGLSFNSATGQFTYNPPANFNGSVTFQYEVRDVDGDTDIATVTINVTPVNDPVDAKDDSFTTREDTPISFTVANLLANDSAPDGGLAFVRTVGALPAGLSFNSATGQFTYNPPANFNGSVTFQYEVRDVDGDTDIATVTINVTPVNDPVDAKDDSFTTREDTPISFTTANLLANDSAPDGGLAFVRTVGTLPAGLSFNSATGQFTYNPPANFNGSVTFQYEVRDVDGDTDIATVTINVTPVNDPVDAKDDSFTTREDTPISFTVANLLANDSAPDGGLAFVRTVGALPAGLSYNSATGQFTYNPPANFNGSVTFQYEVRDVDGDTDIATVTINVTPVNDPVDAKDDSFTVRAGQSVSFTTGNLLANDSAPDGGLAFVRTVGTLPAGLVYNSATGQFTYNAPVGSTGKVTFQYEVRDADGDTDIATVTINITPNSVVANNDTATLKSNADSVLVNVLANDSDPQGDSFKINRIVSMTGGDGKVTIENGQIRYTDADHRVAHTVTIVYEIIDALGAKDTATVTIKVEADSNNVVAVDDSAILAKDADSVLVNVLKNDYDPQGDKFSISRIVSVSGGDGKATIENGQIRYTDATHRTAETVKIVYEIVDQYGAKDTATVTIKVEADSNSVVAVNDTATLGKDIDSVLVDVLKNDYDPQGDKFSISRIVSMTGGDGKVTIENGKIRYTDADHREAHTVKIVYEIVDQYGAKDTATVTINVQADGNSVVAVNDSATLAKDADSVLVNVLANDYDPQGDSFKISRIVSMTGGDGKVTIENGQIRYTDATHREAHTVKIVYEIVDKYGATDQATVTINVQADSNSVIAKDDTATLKSNVDSVLVNVLANDSDPQGDSFKISRIVSMTGGDGKVTIENGQIRYTDADHREAHTVKIVYEIVDEFGAKDTATVTIKVEADGNNVVAVNDSATLAKDANSVLINVLKNDYDPQGDSFKINRVVSVTGGDGKVTIENGQLRYTDATHRTNETVKIVYEIIDQYGAKDTATVTVDVKADTNSVNAKNDAYTVGRSTTTNLNVLANDSDPQGDSFSVSRIISGPSIGSVSINSNGTIRYVASSSTQGYTTTFVYEIVDQYGAKDTATVTVTVPRTGGGGGGGGDGGGDCPLTIDLNGDGISVGFLSESHAFFDLNGDGIAEHTAWVNGIDDAILAIDRDGNGEINGIHEVFGGQGVDGFTELARLEDSNGDGVVDANDANWSQLRLWLDKNGDGKSEESELFTLDHFGITAINLGTTDVSIQYGDAYINKTGTVTLADGTTLNAGTVFYTNNSNGHLTGTGNDDVLIYSAAADSIDGGQGFDTLKVLTASDIVLSHDSVKGVEAIDLANNGADKLELNINDVLTMSDNGILTIKGDAVDEITLTGGATRGDDVTQNGHTYASYTGGNGGTVLVELGLTVHHENQN